VAFVQGEEKRGFVVKATHRTEVEAAFRKGAPTLGQGVGRGDQVKIGMLVLHIHRRPVGCQRQQTALEKSQVVVFCAEIGCQGDDRHRQ